MSYCTRVYRHRNAQASEERQPPFFMKADAGSQFGQPPFFSGATRDDAKKETTADALPSVQRKGLGGPLDLQPDACVTAPGIGTICGSGAAKLCSKMDLPGCGLVCRFFDCTKPKTPGIFCPPGWRAAGSSAFEGQCCLGAADSQENCCPPSRIAFLDNRCCRPDEVILENRCKKMELPPVQLPCFPPAKRSLLGDKCCFPPEVPKGLGCGLPDVKPVPKQPPVVPHPVEIFFKKDRPFSGETGATASSAMTSEGKANFNNLVQSLRDDPSLKVQLVGRASPEGGEAYNLQLGKRRAAMIAAALKEAGIPGSQIADPPTPDLSSACVALEPGLVSCGEEGATGDKDRQVLARVFSGN